MSRENAEEVWLWCERMGYEAIMLGPSQESNCAPEMFTTPERTLAWQRGMMRAVHERWPLAQSPAPAQEAWTAEELAAADAEAVRRYNAATVAAPAAVSDSEKDALVARLAAVERNELCDIYPHLRPVIRDARLAIEQQAKRLADAEGELALAMVIVDREGNRNDALNAAKIALAKAEERLAEAEKDRDAARSECANLIHDNSRIYQRETDAQNALAKAEARLAEVSTVGSISYYRAEMAEGKLKRAEERLAEVIAAADKLYARLLEKCDSTDLMTDDEADAITRYKFIRVARGAK